MREGLLLFQTKARALKIRPVHRRGNEPAKRDTTAAKRPLTGRDSLTSRRRFFGVRPCPDDLAPSGCRRVWSAPPQASLSRLFVTPRASPSDEALFVPASMERTVRPSGPRDLRDRQDQLKPPHQIRPCRGHSAVIATGGRHALAKFFSGAGVFRPRRLTGGTHL